MPARPPTLKGGATLARVRQVVECGIGETCGGSVTSLLSTKTMCDVWGLSGDDRSWVPADGGHRVGTGTL